MRAIYEEAGMRDDRVYDWQESTLGEWDEWGAEMGKRDRDREWGDWGFVPFVILLAALTLTVVILAVV